MSSSSGPETRDCVRRWPPPSTAHRSPCSSAPREERGGNSAFTAGAMRVRYDGPADLHRLMPDLTEAEWENDFGTYPAEAYYDDMARVTRVPL